MINTMTKGFRDLESKFLKVAPVAVYRKVNGMMVEMKRRTPVDTGTLRDSGQVDPPVFKGKIIYITFGFGGAAEEYAIIVHEDLNARHEQGQAKFMESVIKENEPTFLDEVGEDILQMLGL